MYEIQTGGLQLTRREGNDRVFKMDARKSHDRMNLALMRKFGKHHDGKSVKLCCRLQTLKY